MSTNVWDEFLRIRDELLKIRKENLRFEGDKFKRKNWSKLSTVEKSNQVNAFIDFMIKELNITNKPTWSFSTSLGKDVAGAYYPLRNKIIIAESLLCKKSGKELALTIGHELRHAYQRQLYLNSENLKKVSGRYTTAENRILYYINNPKHEPATEWGRNMFISYISEGPGYWKQPVEKDAHAYEADLSEMLFGQNFRKEINKKLKKIRNKYLNFQKNKRGG
ncbi:M48 family metalloprotease [Priestia megaterium]|uniref:M48 family metalloprotease n=1 Tax=Priestia megaterium TaxID=1404 RepID=UPI003D027063